jgi:hypothetical protein
MSEARDRYREFFTEKLWQLMPSAFRDRDTRDVTTRSFVSSWTPAGTIEPDDAGPLYAFLRALAQEAAVLKRSQDRLWSDRFVELADDWAIPYIADLVATRLVSSLNTRARRADVAKTIFYRRRKGTLRVLEQLIADMTGWDGVVIEEFRRLGRMRHGLDPRAREGRLTGTPEGGWADLRHPRGARLARTPFDEFHYTPDVRRPRGKDGWYGIFKLGVHVCRLAAVELTGVTPRRLRTIAPNVQGLTFDPSGRDVALFATNAPRADFTAWHRAREWELPRSIPCLLLGDAQFTISPFEVAAVRVNAALPAASRDPAADELAKLAGGHFRSEDDLRTVLASRPHGTDLTNPGVIGPMLVSALDAACGKAALLPATSADIGGGSIDAVQTVGLVSTTVPRGDTDAANLSTWPAVWPAGTRPLRIDPDRGRFVIDRSAQPAATLTVRYFVGMPGRVGAGGYARDIEVPTGVFNQWQNGSSAAGIRNNGLTYVADSTTCSAPPDNITIQNAQIVAADQKRPYVRLNADWRLGSGIPAGQLRIDGLWIGASAAATVVIQGDFEIVDIASCTFDPGGADADGAAILAVPLVVTGRIGHLRVSRSILNEIRLGGAGVIERLEIADSIVQIRTPGTAALTLPDTDTNIVRTTVLAARLGDVVIDVDQLYASELLCTGTIDVTNTQAGCFRFSAAVSGSRVPHPYESRELTDVAALFTSTRFGDAGFAQISDAAPATIARGAEDGAEMGAFASEINPIKEDSLTAKVEEYMPFGLLPFVVHEN